MGQSVYVEDWVRVFYSTVWFGQDRQMIWFMFGGEPYFLSRAKLAELLGVDLADTSIHNVIW